MQSRALGFMKMAMDSTDLAGLLGAAAAYAATKGRPHQIARIGAAVLGYQTGTALAEGVHGAVHKPDFTGLTIAEKKVITERAREQQESRAGRRIGAVAAGAGALMLTGDPLVLMAALPAATIHPYRAESRYISDLADQYRAARRHE